MNAWVTEELSTVNISDERLERRMRKILDRVESKPGVSLPAACKGWDETNGAYHCYIQIGGIVQGLLMHLSVNFGSTAWKSFRSWLRTMEKGLPPSEMVVPYALRSSLPIFL